MLTSTDRNDTQEDTAGESRNMIDVYDQSYFNTIAKQNKNAQITEVNTPGDPRRILKNEHL